MCVCSFSRKNLWTHSLLVRTFFLFLNVSDGTQVGNKYTLKLILAKQFCITEHQRIEFKMPYLPCACFVCSCIKHGITFFGTTGITSSRSHSNTQSSIGSCGMQFCFHLNVTFSLVFSIQICLHVRSRLFSLGLNSTIMAFLSYRRGLVLELNYMVFEQINM